MYKLQKAKNERKRKQIKGKLLPLGGAIFQSRGQAVNGYNARRRNGIEEGLRGSRVLILFYREAIN